MQIGTVSGLWFCGRSWRFKIHFGVNIMCFRKSYICSNKLDVQETNISFSQFNRIWEHCTLVLFRTTRITPHCPFHGSSPSNFCWMGCRRYSAASRLEVLLDGDDFRSFSRALERGSFLFVSQLHVPILTLWINVYFLELGEQTCWLLTHGSPRSCLICVYVFVCVFVFVNTFNRHWHTTQNRSLRSWVCAFATKQDILSDLLSERTRWLLTQSFFF